MLFESVTSGQRKDPPADQSRDQGERQNALLGLSRVGGSVPVQRPNISTLLQVSWARTFHRSKVTCAGLRPSKAGKALRQGRASDIRPLMHKILPKRKKSTPLLTTHESKFMLRSLG